MTGLNRIEKLVAHLQEDDLGDNNHNHNHNKQLVRHPSSSLRPIITTDVLLIGAGFSGLINAIQLKKRTSKKFIIVDRQEKVGGTWLNNRYPGCECDVPSVAYFPLSLLPGFVPSRLYPGQEEIQHFCEEMASHHGLLDAFKGGMDIDRIAFDDDAQEWVSHAKNGTTFRSKFLILGNGPLSEPVTPKFPRMNEFKGEIYHTGDWPEDRLGVVTGKRVAVVGTGASAVQMIQTIAKPGIAREVHVCQRTATYCMARNDRPITGPVRQKILDNPSYPDAKRKDYHERIENALWETFDDPVKNEQYKVQVHEKIKSVVKDPKVAEQLCPQYRVGCKRVIVSDEYYECFNKPHVKLHHDPKGVSRITANGVCIGDEEKEIECDVIAMATGFDATMAIFKSTSITGRRGKNLQDYWVRGPKTMFGLMIDDFPNLFISLGPQGFSPYVNSVDVIRFQADWISRLVQFMEQRKLDTAEPEKVAVDEWASYCKQLGHRSVWATCSNWYNAGDLDNEATFFFGEWSTYVNPVEEEVQQNFPHFKFS